MSTTRASLRLRHVWRLTVLLTLTLTRLLALTLGLGLVPSLAAAGSSAQLLHIRSAQVMPALGAVATVALPDDWSRSRPAFAGTVVYRVDFEHASSLDRGDLLALYITHVCSNLEVFLNGHLVHGGGRMVEPVTHNCNHPQLVSLPSALVRAGANTIDIRVTGHRLAEVGSHQRDGGLSALVIGPQSQLAVQHAQRTALQVSAPQAISATLLLMGGFMFVMGFVNRRESHLAYFGALSVGWAIVDARLWLRTLPVSHSVAEFLLCSMLGFITWAAVQFLVRYAGSRVRWVDLALPVQCAMLPLSLVLAGPTRLFMAANVWYAVLALQVLAAAVWHLRREWHRRSVWLMAVMLFTVVVAGSIEFAAQWGGTRPLAAHLASLALPVVFVLVGLRLVQQQGRALHHAEQGKARLEQRVREASAEIERNFRQMSELRVEQVTERERKRIAADLHDDLGAKLLTIVHTSDSERISTLAREALEEMRLSVRGLTGKPVRLADALGDWRAEVVSRLGQAGIQCEWQAPEELPQRLSSRAYVQTTRILREATSNIIKHSKATRCDIHCTISDGDMQFVLQDDGDGISTAVESRLDQGHGLASMKNRAKQLQGQCLVESGAGQGTVIRLTVPLDRATEVT